MFRKGKGSKKNKKSKQIATYLLGDVWTAPNGRKGKQKNKKYVGFSHEEINDICTSMETVKGVRILRTW